MTVQNDRYRVVLDTNWVVAAGTRWLEHGMPNPDLNLSRRILVQVAEVHTGLYCGQIIGEYLEKLVDRRHPQERILRMITYLMGAFHRVEITSQAAPVQPPDPDDEIFLLCALDGDADYLVSEDRDLTNLRLQYTRPIIGRGFDLAVALGA